jgi:hypothetical protein
MSISVLQTPEDIQPAQSPIVFSVTETTQAYTASEFQYVANLYVWSGNYNQSGSYIYQARKYPNATGSGIFDFSKMINSTLTDLSATNGSNIKWYKAEFGWQYASGSTYVTQSGGLTQVTSSINESTQSYFRAYDGYDTFLNQYSYTNPNYYFDSFINGGIGVESLGFPIMSDAYLVTQSVLSTDHSDLANQTNRRYEKGLSVFVGRSVAGGPFTPSNISITASYTTGTILSASYNTNPYTASLTSSAQIIHISCAPSDVSWSLDWPTIPTASLDSYSFRAHPYQAARFNYQVVCESYYTPVRIAFKNKYGQFDFLNFYKRHNTTFETDQRLYQPQLGSWGARTLQIDNFQTKQQRYIVDATQTLECNTDWLEEGWNNLMQQLLVSDEIYWLYGQRNPNRLTLPLTIKTNNLLFKTGVNNKLIQYTITFDIGQPYKLIL